MIVINKTFDINLVRTHTGWHLQINDRDWRLLDEVKKTNYFPDNEILQYFIENLDNTFGVQGTNIQSLAIPKQLVAQWILDGKI